MTNYEAKVKEVYPKAIAKKWSYDNGSGYTSFWSVAKEDELSYNPNNQLTAPATTKKKAWQSAYETLAKQNKIIK